MYNLFTFLALALTALINAYVPESTLATDLEAAKSLVKLLDTLESGALKQFFLGKAVEQSCTVSRLVVRRE